MLCIKLMKKLNNIQNNKSKEAITENDSNKEKNSMAADNTTDILNNTNEIYSINQSEKEINLTSSSSSSFSPCFNMNKL